MNTHAEHPLARCVTLRVMAGAATLATALVACGGGGDTATPPVVVPPPVVAVTAFTQTALVADGGGAAHTDPNLVNAWGIAFNPTGFVWVNDNGTSKSTLYDGNGVPQSLVVSTPDAPTGIVFNATQDFKVAQNGKTGASPFVFASESGTISAWSPSVNPTVAVTMFDGSAGGNVYKGLANAGYLGVNYLYATDFHNKRIDVFDTNFNKVALPGGFVDAQLPADYAPFGIQAVGQQIYVSYAQRQASGDDESHSAGAGVVDVFDTAGNLLKRLVTAGALNAPWGIAVAPSNFGTFSGKLLVANFGDGKINAYDASSGAYAGTLAKADGTPLVLDGLWGIAFGNGVNSQPANTLFYTAGPGDEAHGVYGRIDMNP
ncbi:TIGR03118 family protein [Rugamonas sp.]|uniref:TIGR03118 family protein n=1 Tax=Rugamonas sp. TaxID=1926287 RepID=UPI0025D53DD9|nr:TIGR03118 family protein [Rugamonas sp.]